MSRVDFGMLLLAPAASTRQPQMGGAWRTGGAWSCLQRKTQIDNDIYASNL